MAIKDLFGQEIKAINLGSPSFADDLKLQNVSVTHLDWTPPCNGDMKLINALKKVELYRDKIDAANEEAVKRVKEAEGRLIGIDLAKNVVPGFKDKKIICYAGPWIKYENMCGPVKGAIIGAILFEGWAKTYEEATKLAESGEIVYEPCHEHSAVGPMAGILSPSMPVHIIYNEVHGNYAYCSINEGLGKVLRFGANSSDVIARLEFLRDTFRKVVNDALKIIGGVDVKNIIAQAVQMGDECHNRNKAATALFYKEIAIGILKTKYSDEEKTKCLEFISKNEHYFLNLSMPYCKVSLDTARNIKYSTLVVCMCRNGVEFGIQVAGLGNKWFTYQANFVQGLFFPGFSQDDAARDLGDSAITETRGIGGFAMASAPAIVQFVGGKVGDAFNYSLKMNEICLSSNDSFVIPPLDFKFTAFGIDIIKVIETNVLPIINTGMAHKEPGIGQVGAGLVTPPYECFVKALEAFIETLE